MIFRTNRAVSASLFSAVLLATTAYVGAPLFAAEPAMFASHVYTESNATKNEIIHFGRNADGTLVEMERVSTDGAGTNGFKPATGEASAPDTLLSAGSVAMSADHKMLFAVNAGDNSVSSFAVGENGKLTLIDHKATGEKGVTSSLTYNDRTKTLFVLHTLGPKHIRAFKVKNGKLTNTGDGYTINTGKLKDRIPTQIIASPDGRFVLVDVLFNAPPAPGADGPVLTPSNAGTKDGVVVFPVKKDGSLGKAVLNDAGGPTPFSMAFLHGSSTTFVNTLAAGNGVVLSTLSKDGKLTNSAVAPVDLTAAPKGPSETCWVAISPDNKFAYSTNFGLGNITSYAFPVLASLRLRTISAR